MAYDACQDSGGGDNGDVREGGCIACVGHEQRAGRQEYVRMPHMAGKGGGSAHDHDVNVETSFDQRIANGVNGLCAGIRACKAFDRIMVVNVAVVAVHAAHGNAGQCRECAICII